MRVLASRLLLGGIVCLAASTFAQEVFDVASVKPNRSGSTEIFFNILPDGHYRAVNATVREIIRSAYGFDYQMFQIVDGPAWIDTERFDIDAKPSGAASPEQVALMVRSLLGDRFRLILRTATRDLPIYALVRTRPDAPLGAQLRRASGNCQTMQLGANGIPGPSAPDAPRCGVRIGPGPNGARLTVVGRTVEQIAAGLRPHVERWVVDATGLTGTFDAEIDFAREQRRIGPPIDPSALEAPPSAVSIYTAVQEQLGLRLESRRGPVEVLVIDRIERPASN
jgi:uncharacterized protein (TIGR03435 family)